MTTLDRPTTAPASTPRPTHLIEVVATRWLTPHMVRVVFAADSLAELSPDLHADAYVKITFLTPGEDLPVRRTYTVRSYDPLTRQLTIDFVVHGDEGIAGPWAAAAQPGDQLTISRPGGGYTPSASADWHLLAGDEAATPAIAAALEAMPADAIGDAFIEVGSEDDHQPLTHPSGITVHWLHRDGDAGTSTVLADAVAQTPWREGTVQVFVHGERGMVKQLRDYLKRVRAVSREQLSLSGYWAYGRTEDRFQAEKREPIGQISLD